MAAGLTPSLGSWKVTVVLLALLHPAAWRADASGLDPVEAAAGPTGGVLSRSEIAAFADSVIPTALETSSIPGAAVSVVQDGRVLLQRGYGLADVDEKRPVSANETRFRVASISKILTAAAALRLAQSDRLDLHEDVNHVLQRFVIAPAYDEPITLHDLLTHTSGFDVCWLGYAARSPADHLSLRDYLSCFQPQRLRPPGSFSTYDNYGYALAGYLVQVASEVPFRDYVRTRILEPLGMSHSGFGMNRAMAGTRATGYRRVDGTLEACAPDYVNITPAAGLLTTAADMSRLLIALLAEDGSTASPRLSTAVRTGLMTSQFTFHPDVPGRCYGFNRLTVEGRPLLRQTGQWPGFNAMLMVSPRQRIGLFLAYNVCDELEAGRRIGRAFVERFIPKPVPAGSQSPTRAGTGLHADLFPGCYASTRYPRATPHVKSPRQVVVRWRAEGGLTIEDQPYLEIEPAVFERLSASAPQGRSLGRRVAFRLDENGRVSHLITQSGAYRRLAWYETRRAQNALNVALCLIWLTGLVIWPLADLVRWGRRRITQGITNHRPRRPSPRLDLPVKIGARAVCAVGLWLQIALALAANSLGPFALFYGLPPRLESILRISLLLVLLTLVMGVAGVLVWRHRFWTLPERILFTLVTMGGLLGCWNLNARYLHGSGARECPPAHAPPGRAEAASAKAGPSTAPGC